MGASSGPEKPLIGTTLGERYRLLSSLGSGAMGDVYLAEHVVLGKKMAVKVLKQDCCRSEELVKRFQQEAIAASRIGHENIVSVTDFGRTDDGALYFVMEALEGESLGKIVSRGGALGLERALHLLLQICRALAAAHARGIVHRDLKLDNVVVVPRDDGSELAKVLDFGISKVSDLANGGVQRHTTQVGTLLGTPDYMSPEQIRGDPVDHRADIYAFGVIAYELTTGTVPFEAKSVTDVLVRHLTSPVAPPSQRRPAGEIPAVFDSFVLRAWEKDREQRFQSMTEVRDALARCLEAIGAGPALTPPRPIAALATFSAAAVEGSPKADPTLKDTFTSVEPPQVSTPIERPRASAGRSGLWAGVLGGGLIVASAAAVGWWALIRPAPTPVAIPQAPAPAPVVAVPAPAPSPPQPPPAVVAPPAEAVAAAPTVARPAPPVLARLEGKDVARVFAQSQGRLRKCIQDHRALLPAPSGRLEISFTIRDSGAVSAASVKSKLDPALSNCLTARITELKFPKHREPTQTFDLPLDYALKD